MEILRKRSELSKSVSPGHGRIIELGSDCIMADFTTTADTVLKSTSSPQFEIIECKKFFYVRVPVQVEIVFKINMNLFVFNLI